MATKVKLREKPISGKRQTLYLDFYPPVQDPETGKETRREFLTMFIFSEIEYEKQKYLDKKGKSQTRYIPVLDKNYNPKKIRLTPACRHHNNKTRQLAELIRQKRENQINKPEIYNEFEKEQLKIKEKGEHSFVEYFKSIADKRSGSNHNCWMSAYRYLETFTKGSLKFSDLNEKFCDEFRYHLLTTKSNKSIKSKLSQNSALSYYNKFKAVLKQAFREGYIRTDLNSRTESIKPSETERTFLTLEELNKLVKTECQNPMLKNAALFSALTGLRFSDIKKLVWGEIEFEKGNGYFIRFRQQKTKGYEILPIPDQAAALLGERKGPKENVFQGLTYSAYQNKHLYQWIGAAGITKNITFHSFRHTFATLQLSSGTDIFVISKLLGHRELKTTLIYTHLLDKAKRDAVNKIKLNS